MDANLSGSGPSREQRSRPWLGWILPLCILAVWEIGSQTGILPSALAPPPTAVFAAGVDLVRNGVLLNHLWISTVRVFVGGTAGIIFGIVLGAYVGLSRRGEEILDPTLQMLRTIPVLALTPLFILWFGIGELGKLVLLAFSTFFPAYINTFAGTRDVDRKQIEVGWVCDLTPRQIVTEIILPASMPHVLVGIRYGLQVAWLVLIVAEMLGATAGLGFMIREAQSFLRTDRVMLGIVAFALAGKLVDTLLRMLEAKMLRWRSAFEGN